MAGKGKRKKPADGVTLPLQEILEHAPDTIVVFGPDFRYRYINQGGAKRLGRTVADVIGRRPEEIFPPNVAARQVSALSEVMKTNRLFEVDLFHMAGPHEAWFNVRLVPYPGGDRELELIIGFIRNVTDRYRALEAVQEREQDLRDALENANDGVVWADRSAMTILHVNRACLRLFGWRDSDYAGRTILELHPPDQAEYYRRQFSRHVAGEADCVNCEAVCADGKVRKVNLSVSFSRYQGHNVIIGFFRVVDGQLQ